MSERLRLSSSAHARTGCARVRTGCKGNHAAAAGATCALGVVLSGEVTSSLFEFI